MRLIDADALTKQVVEKLHITNSRKDIIDLIDNTPTIEPNELDFDIDYSIEYDKRPDGISNAKVTITRIKPKTIANNCDLISRADAICEVLVNDGIDNIVDRINALPSADRPKVNSNSAEEQIAEICDRPKGEWIDNPQPYVPEASTERVVHCKDCVYSRQPEGELFVCENRFGMSGWVRENEFCSSGSLK